jgi:prepilin-type N-terminal cleavage/methylation domain-containing protein
MQRRQPRAGFTLIELLVVISIIAVLAALLLPVYSSIFKKSNETITLSNMRQLGVACLLYVGDHNFQLPNRAQAQPGEDQPDKWPKLFQPYVQDLRVYTSPIPDVNGKSYKVTNQTDLLSNSANNTSYICNGYNDLGALTDATIFPRVNVIDHPSQTILFGIPYPKAFQFYMDFSEGGGNNNEVLNRAAFTGSTSVYVMSDGSAHTLQYNPSDDMKSAPKSAGYYTDWLWLIDKSQTGIIQ